MFRVANPLNIVCIHLFPTSKTDLSYIQALPNFQTKYDRASEGRVSKKLCYLLRKLLFQSVSS